jgi:hypothetical protein
VRIILKLTLETSLVNFPECSGQGSVTGFFKYGDDPSHKRYRRIFDDKRGRTQKFPDWPPGARTANGKALCH